MQADDFRYQLDSDGVAQIIWDVADKTMNVMSRSGFELLDALIDKALADPDVKGVVITSAKKDFSGGMDLNVLSNLYQEAGKRPAEAIFDFLINGHRVLRKIERAGMSPKTNAGGKPIACAIPGFCAGLGTEIALACHRRFMSARAGAKIGLPEILVGLFPGAGGTTRYVRTVGVMAAAPILLEGKMLSPKQAVGAKLVDEIVAPDDLVARAKEWILNASDSDLLKPWDQKGFRIPGGGPYHPAGFMTFLGAVAMVNGRTQGAYPAPKALLSAIYEGALVPFDTALKIEARWFVKVLMDPSSSNMIRTLFVSKQALEKGAARPREIADQTVKKLGIIGSGMMGAGIAFVAAEAGIEVVLLDTKIENAEKGKAFSEKILDKRIARAKATLSQKEEVLTRITPSVEFAKLAEADLIVEAVFEDPAIKREVIKKVAAVIGQECIFASNTSTLPITELGEAFPRPDQFIGIHFFSPVDRMRLVEIIKGKKTGARAIAKALDFTRQIKKTPIVITDARFFYANRCVFPYLNEGMRMVSEGVAPALIENAARQLGMPLGPLQLIDEVSIDLGARIARTTKAALGAAYDSDASDKMLFWMEDAGRLGRKAKAGFYAYDDAGQRLMLWDGLCARYKQAPLQPAPSEVKERLLLIQSLEAVRALEENVLEDVREGDVGAILGWGFAPWTGGPFGWLDMLGSKNAVALCKRLAKNHGPRFAPPALLSDYAAKGQGFYKTA